MITKKGWLFTYILWNKELNICGLIFFISGGIVGFSQNTNALGKWTLTAHLVLKKENAPQTTKSGKSEKIVQELLRAFSRVANLFTFDWTSDVNNKYPLMTICCSVVMRNEDAEQLLQASSIGEQEIGKAVSKKFNSTTTFSARIKKVMLPTFVPLASIALQPIVEIKMHLYDRKVFQRLAVIEMSRTVDLGDILTYELGPATLSLA